MGTRPAGPIRGDASTASVRNGVCDSYTFNAWVGLVGAVLGVATHLAYFLRQRWSRVAVLVPYLGVIVAEGVLLVVRPDPGWLDVAVLGIFVVAGVPAVVAWGRPLNRLAFGLEVPRARLDAARQAFADNRLAGVALALSLLTAVLPFFFLTALPLALDALFRGRAPGGRHGGPALAAVCLCGLGLLTTLAFPVLLAGHL